MSHKLFHITDENPNVVHPACVCSENPQPDCKPPFAVFPGNEMDNAAAPHVVICQSCAAAVVERMADFNPPIDVEAVEEQPAPSDVPEV